MERYVVTEVKEKYNGREYYYPLGAKAENVITNDDMQFISKAELNELKTKPSPTSPVNNNTVTFTQTATRINISSGDTLSVLFGKIKKWLNDLRSAAFHEATNSLEITNAGYVLDARAGKAINDKFGGMRFYEDSAGKWVIGADSVPKKLGSGKIKRIDLGNVSGNTIIDVKPHYDNWADLTNDNFALDGCYARKNGAQGENNWSDSSLSKSWNPANGELIITKNIDGDPPKAINLSSKVILFVCE